MYSDQSGKAFSYPPSLNEALLNAIRANNAARTEELLTFGANANCCNNYNEPVLIEAINTGNINIVRALFDNGANIFVYDKDAQSSLTKAIKLGLIDISIDMICILENLANNSQSQEAVAASNLMKEGMIEAIKSNQINIAQFLSAPCDIYNLDQYGNSALMHACMNDRLEIVKVLMIPNYDSSNEEDDDIYDFELLFHKNIYGYSVIDFNLSSPIKEFLNLAHQHYEQPEGGEASSTNNENMVIDNDNSQDPYTYSDYQLSGETSDIDENGANPS